MTHTGVVRAAEAAVRPLELAVILPTLNERANLGPLVERLDAALDGLAWEAIFVDDNSPDGTADEARAISLRDPRIRVIQRIGRRGLASAAIEGMLATAAPALDVTGNAIIAGAADASPRIFERLEFPEFLDLEP